MAITKKTLITVKSIINTPVATVWKLWTNPDDIIRWNNASDDWQTTRAENDPRVGGNFLWRMEAKDGSVGFDFGGVYTTVIVNRQLGYTLGDGRKVNVTFSGSDSKTNITESFEAEETNPVEMQRNGWQSILDNFKKYAEASSQE
jgi:uncharacterized protein YndB with AHSA1/START domain